MAYAGFPGRSGLFEAFDDMRDGEFRRRFANRWQRLECKWQSRLEHRHSLETSRDQVSQVIVHEEAICKYTCRRQALMLSTSASPQP